VVKETVAFVIPANPGSGSRADAGIQRISSSTLLATVVWLITVSRLLAMFQLNELYELYEPNEPNELNELFQRIMVCVPGIRRGDYLQDATPMLGGESTHNDTGKRDG